MAELHAMACAVYVSNADSHEVSVLRLDCAAGELSLVETVAVGGVAMPMALGREGRVLYVGLRSQPFRVVSFAVDPASGRLTKLGESALADSMAYLSVDATGRWLFAASYGGHTISVNAIDAHGVVGAVAQLIATPPNAHAIRADASNRFVFVTHLGGDVLSSWRFDAAAGTLDANTPALVTTPAKSGPRHFTWDASGRHLYLLGELDASITLFDVDAERGTLHERQHQGQRTQALPAGFTGTPWAADLHLTPDGRHLYASERRSSTITAFRVDAASGELTTLDTVPTEATPRGFAIDPSGRFLVAAGQESNAVALYAIDAASGALAQRQRLAVGKNPNWVEICDLP